MTNHGGTFRLARLFTVFALAVAVVATESIPGVEAAPAVPAAAPTPVVVYDSFVESYTPSQAYQANQTGEWGDRVQLADGATRLDSVTVKMSSYACGVSGDWDTGCVTVPGSTFDHPLTLNIYRPDSTSPSGIGDLIATTTKTVTMPYRPSADPGCVSISGYAGDFRQQDNTCVPAIQFPVTFELPSMPEVPGEIVWTVATNTTTYGSSPIGPKPCNSESRGCPYDSLNLAANFGSVNVGVDVAKTEVAGDSKSATFRCGNTNFGQLELTKPCWDRTFQVKISAIEPTVTESTVVVTESTSGWSFVDDTNDSIATASGQFVVDATSPLSDGSAELSVTGAADGQALLGDVLGGTPLASLTDLEYSSSQPGGRPQALVLQFSIQYDPANTGWQGRLTYEPYLNGGDPAAGWVRWDTLPGSWWASGLPGKTYCPQSDPCDWVEVLSLWPNAQIHETLTQIGFKAGSGWEAFSGNVDQLTVGVGDGAGNIARTTYDFEPLADPTCESVATTTITDISEFDRTVIRSKGHFELQAGAARLFTDDASSNAKVAGYVNASSSTLGDSFDIDWTQTFGTIAPGVNVGLSDGSILVGEAVYGNSFWVSEGPASGYAPQVGGGHGSPYHGTPAEWQTVMNARGVTVTEVGFSLGSGVHADGLLTSVTAGCHKITFDLPDPEPPVDPETPVEVRDYNPVPPTRLFDTRPGTPAALRTVAKQKVGPSTPLEVKVTDLPGGLVPASGVGAVTLNVTATGAGQDGYVTVIPCASNGEVSSLNFRTGKDRANLVVVPVSATGTVCFTANVAVDVVVDVNGWFTANAGFVPVTPARIFDTRSGTPPSLRTVAKQQVGPSTPLKVKLTDLPGVVPASGVSAVSLNVTATGSSEPGYVTVFPCGPIGEVSNVNFQTHTDIANAVLIPVSATGEVCFTSSVAVNLVADLNGWLKNPSDFASITPTRVFDTRPGTPPALRTVAQQQVGPSTPLKVKMADLPGGLVPANGVGAVALTVTATGSAQNGYVTVTPCGAAGETSSVNFQAGSDTANAVLTPMSAAGEVCFTADVPVHVVVDVTGWFAD